MIGVFIFIMVIVVLGPVIFGVATRLLLVYSASKTMENIASIKKSVEKEEGDEKQAEPVE